jgi:hypothetical protein
MKVLYFISTYKDHLLYLYLIVPLKLIRTQQTIITIFSYQHKNLSKNMLAITFEREDQVKKAQQYFFIKYIE